jgi:hypothetical protein
MLLMLTLAAALAALLAAPIPQDFPGLLSGLAGVGLTFVGAKLTGWVAGTDARITNAYKSAQPIVAGTLGLLLPYGCQAIGLVDTCPSGDQLAAAPLGTLLGITLLEATKRARGKKRR